jgi:hypothetical protein
LRCAGPSEVFAEAGLAVFLTLAANVISRLRASRKCFRN